jgi:hemoglobin-like flavoprotein
VWLIRRRRQETGVTEEQKPAEQLEVPDPDEGSHRQSLAPAAQRVRSEPGPWDSPTVTDHGPIRREDTTTRLAAWTPEMDKVREIPDPADTMAREVPIRQTPFPPRMAMAGPIGRSAVPRPMVSQTREACPHCQGAGYMPNVNDYLRESVALLGDQGDAVIRTFYVQLFRSAPEVAALFPGDPTKGDLGSDHKGAQQREKLLAAIVALSDLYDPEDPDKMERLDRALGSFGRSHASFVRKDGTIRGANWEEYAAVKEALFSTLVTAAAEAWKAEYTEAWSQAYDYAAAVMIAEQHRSGFSAPRFPRA